MAHSLDEQKGELAGLELLGLAGVQVAPEGRFQPVIYELPLLLRLLDNGLRAPSRVVEGEKMFQFLVRNGVQHGWIPPFYDSMLFNIANRRGDDNRKRHKNEYFLFFF